MRWWTIPIVAALGWFAFTLTPFWALYGLARAVEARDAAYIERHVNFRTLRLSLIRQISAAARAAPEAQTRERQRFGDAVTALALPLAEALVTPQTVVDLLDDGWPQSLDLPGPAGGAPDAGQGVGERGLQFEDLRRLAAFYVGSDMRGFRNILIGVPPDLPRERQFRVRLRLRGWLWRLVDIELTEELRARIAQKMSRATKPGGEATGTHDVPTRPAPSNLP